MLFSRLKTKAVTAEDALPGRPDPLPHVPEVHAVNGNRIQPPFPEGVQTAVFGAGCFWGVEKVFWETPGVYSTAAGYAGGFTPEPDVRGGLLGAHRAHRGRPRRLRPGGHLLRAAAQGVLGGPRPDAGHAPGQRRRHPVPLGDLLPTPEQEKAALAEPRGVPGAADGGRLRRDHHRDRAAGHVLLRRGLPPAVPLQGAERLLPGALDGRLLPGRPPRASEAQTPRLASTSCGGTRTSRRRSSSPSTPTDRLLLDTAAELIAACGPGEVAVVDDGYGALTLGAVALHGAQDVRVAQDLLVGELALARNAERTGLAGAYRSVPLSPALAAGARVVLVQAPKGLEALREIAEVVAALGGARRHRARRRPGQAHDPRDERRPAGLLRRRLGRPRAAEVAGAGRPRPEAGRRRPSRAARTIPTSG